MWDDTSIFFITKLYLLTVVPWGKVLGCVGFKEVVITSFITTSRVKPSQKEWRNVITWIYVVNLTFSWVIRACVSSFECWGFNGNCLPLKNVSSYGVFLYFILLYDYNLYLILYLITLLVTIITALCSTTISLFTWKKAWCLKTGMMSVNAKRA